MHTRVWACAALLFRGTECVGLQSDESTLSDDKLIIRMLPSRHMRVGRVVMESMLASIREAVDRSIDDFWASHPPIHNGDFNFPKSKSAELNYALNTQRADHDSDRNLKLFASFIDAQNNEETETETSAAPAEATK